MILYPNAKINVGLFITEKREDGIHNIESIFYPVAIHDILEIIAADEFKFTTSGIPVNVDYNLVIEAYELMRSKFQIGAVQIHLHKQIALGAGLGGGSADATFCLIGLNALFSLNLSNKELEELALELGSDCPFFVSNKPCKISGRGEIMTSTHLDLSGMYAKIVFPEIHISTPEAFAKVVPEKRVFPNELSQLTNDFEPILFKQLPQLKVIKDQLKAEGALYASLSGSGSTIFGIFQKKPSTTNSYPFEKVVELE